MSADLRKQAVAMFTLVATLIALSVVLQLWLLGATLEGVLAGTGELVGPATIASAVLFAVNAALLGYVLRMDRRVRAQRP
jgi:hypothetical protein